MSTETYNGWTMTITEIPAYTHEGILCRFPQAGSWVRLENCPECGTTCDTPVRPAADRNPTVECDCGCNISIHSDL